MSEHYEPYTYREFGGREGFYSEIAKRLNSPPAKSAWKEYRKRIKGNKQKFGIFANVLARYIASENCFPMNDAWVTRAEWERDIEDFERAKKKIEEVLRTYFWERLSPNDPLYDPELSKVTVNLDAAFEGLKGFFPPEHRWPVVRSPMSYCRNYFVRGLMRFHLAVFGSPLYGTITIIWNCLLYGSEYVMDKEQVVQICRNHLDEDASIQVMLVPKEQRDSKPVSVSLALEKLDESGVVKQASN
jgi:hypothetical protein